MLGVPQLAHLGAGAGQGLLEAATVRRVQFAGGHLQAGVVEVVAIVPRRRIDRIGRGALVHVAEADVQPAAVGGQARRVVGACPGVERGARILVEVDQRLRRPHPDVAAVVGDLVAPVTHVPEGAEVEQHTPVAERHGVRIGDRRRDGRARAPGGDRVGPPRHQVHAAVGAVTLVQHVQIAAGVAPDDRRVVVIVARDGAELHRLRPAAARGIVGDRERMAEQCGAGTAAGGVVDDEDSVVVPHRLRAHAHVVHHLFGAVAREWLWCVVHRLLRSGHANPCPRAVVAREWLWCVVHRLLRSGHANPVRAPSLRANGCGALFIAYSVRAMPILSARRRCARMVVVRCSSLTPFGPCQSCPRAVVAREWLRLPGHRLLLWLLIHRSCRCSPCVSRNGRGGYTVPNRTEPEPYRRSSGGRSRRSL